MKKTNLDALSAQYRISDYKELHAKVIALIDSQKIKPVKASGKTESRRPCTGSTGSSRRSRIYRGMSMS